MTHIKIKTTDFSVVFADNKSYFPKHKAGYNGIAEIRDRHKQSVFSRPKNFFVDNYAGLNLEHYFDNHYHPRSVMFHPRKHPMVLKEKDGKSVHLHQDAHAPWEITYDAIFRCEDPNRIFFRCIFKPKSDKIRNSAFLGVFFASYINHPKKIGINFRSNGRWKYFESQKHGDNSTICGSSDQMNIEFSRKIKKHWLFKSYANLFYDKPIYYGINDNIAYIIKFDDPEGYVRLCHSPSGAGPGNPAWDFFMIYPEPKKDEEYSISGNITMKKFKAESDMKKILNEKK